MPHFLLLAATLLLLTNDGQATRYHVNANATGSATGQDWTNAFTNLQEALSVVVPGDAIWVATGQYRPTSGTNRTISFQLRNGVDLYGGFAGTETSIGERDLMANITVLNGDIGEPGSSADNSHRVVTASNINTTIVLDGFRIMNGYSASDSSYDGAGLNVQHALGGNLTVRNCTFVNNYNGGYGGAMYMAAADVTIERCSFVSNSAGTGGDGGAIYNGNNNGGRSRLRISECRFTNNSGRRGACLFAGLEFDELVIDRCSFTNNLSEYSILDLDMTTVASLINSRIIGNTVNGFSSNVLRVNASATSNTFSMVNCTVAHNYNLYVNTIQSEIIRAYGSGHVIANSILFGNTAYSGRQVSANVNISHSIVLGGHANGTAIVDMDPLFNAPYTGTPANFDVDAYQYTLQSGSPGINSGANGLVPISSTMDLIGAPRIQAGTVDMGCYESDFSTDLPQTPTPSPGWYHDAGTNVIRITDVGSVTTGVVCIHDAGGRIVRQAGIAGNELILDLPAGLYLATHPELGRLRFAVR